MNCDTRRRGYLLWDFDGTLGYREGAWSGALHSAATASPWDITVAPETYRAFLKAGYPWHAPDVAHPHLCEPDAWWGALEPVFRDAFAGAGFPPEAVEGLARQVRGNYCDFNSWRLYEGAVETLESLADAGWRHAILSNHVPELPQIVDCLGLGALVGRVFTSAMIGYEKPHPEAFAAAVRELGERPVCMIGDNPLADVQGAESVGIPAILVRSSRPEIRYGHPDFDGIAAAISEITDRPPGRSGGQFASG